MSPPSRRALLCSTAGLVALSAGCLDEAGLSSGDDSDPDEDAGSGGDDTENGDGNGTENGGADENGDENGTENGDDDTESTSGAGETDLESTDSVPFTRTDAPTEPDASLLADADDAGEWLEAHAPDDEEIDEFVDETDFETSVLVALEAEGRNLCYELVVEEVTLDEVPEDDSEPQLVLEASVSDESDGMGCAQQVIAAGRLVRATFTGDPVTDVSITITDHEGSVSAIGIATDSASDSASDTDGESASDS